MAGDRRLPDDDRRSCRSRCRRAGPTGCRRRRRRSSTSASQLFFPAALLVAVLGQRLWGVRLAVSRTLVWSMLTALLIAAYVLLVGLSSLLVPGVDDNVQRVAVTALVAAAIGPLRRFVQRRVDHLIHGEAREPMRMVGRIGRGIDASGTPTELLVGVLDDLVTSLRLNGATIDVNEHRRRGHRATIGDVSGDDELVLPLVLDEQLVGALTVWPRPANGSTGRPSGRWRRSCRPSPSPPSWPPPPRRCRTRAPASPAPATRSGAPCDASCTTGSARRSPA